MVYEALQAGEMLRKKSINARIINIHTIKPIDEQIIINAAKDTGIIITCEEHCIIGGLGSTVAEILLRKCPVILDNIGINDSFGKSGRLDVLRKRFRLTSQDIVNKAISMIKIKKGL